MKKKAIIWGVTGMDGSYLSEFLLEKGYEVHGIVRRASTFNTERIEHILDDNNFHFHYGDVTDVNSINKIVSDIKPDEIYNLSAMSHVKVSFDIPHYTAEVDALGTLNILEAIRTHSKHTKLYQASTSELFGGMEYNRPENGYNEESQMHPRSPYGVAKLYGYWIIRNYRESYNIFASNGILFNHTGLRRGKTFITRKITRGLARIFNGIDTNPLQLGNLEAKRDLGDSRDYIKGMYLMLQQDNPDDYVLATNKMYSVRDIVEKCCEKLGYDLEWVGEGSDEYGIDKNTNRVLIEVNPSYYRPAEVDTLLGDYSKAKKELGWKPEISFEQMITEMLDYDLENEK
jgi:GDPmannose 4,6-dehydratase